MKLTIKTLLEFAKEHNLDEETEIKINGCELHYIFCNDEKIYLDETEEEAQ